MIKLWLEDYAAMMEVLCAGPPSKIPGLDDGVKKRAAAVREYLAREFPPALEGLTAPLQHPLL